MACNAIDFLNLAEKLAGATQKSDVMNRCVVSRAYYSALHVVQETFPSTAGEVREDGNSTHEQANKRVQVYAAALNPINPGRSYAAEIAKSLPKLRRLRNKADYHLNLDIDETFAFDCLNRAKYIADKCDDVLRMRGSSGQTA